MEVWPDGYEPLPRRPFFIVGRAGGFAVDHERARALVVLLGGARGRTGIDPAAFQQAVQRGRLHRVHVHVDGAGELVGTGREAEFGIDMGLREAGAATQRAGFTADLFVQREAGRTGRRRCRHQGQAGRHRVGLQVTHRLGRDRCLHGRGARCAGGRTAGQGHQHGNGQQGAQDGGGRRRHRQVSQRGSRHDRSFTRPRQWPLVMRPDPARPADG